MRAAPTPRSTAPFRPGLRCSASCARPRTNTPPSARAATAWPPPSQREADVRRRDKAAALDRLLELRSAQRAAAELQAEIAAASSRRADRRREEAAQRLADADAAWSGRMAGPRLDLQLA